MASSPEPLYGKPFFDAQSEASLRSARIVLPELLRHVQPRSMVDVGCGIGSWLCAAAELGITELLGADGDYVIRDNLLVDPSQFMAADLSRPGLAASVAAQRPGSFDLVSCLEVAEHLPFERSDSLIDDLCALGDLILFSAAIPFQHGTGHINEQWPEFWATKFRARGFLCYDLIRPEVWCRSEVDWWYAQNTLVFARAASNACMRLPPQAMTGERAIARVHPEAWLSGSLNVFHRQRASARVEELVDFRALVRNWVGKDAQTPILSAVERARKAPADARDVFPFTRTDVVEPEQLIVEANANGKEVRANLAASQRECIELRSNLAEAQAKITALDAEREAERRRAERLKTEIAELQAAGEVHRQSAAQNHERSNVLEANLSQLHQQLEASNRLVDELTATSKSWEQKAIALSADFNTERSSSGQLVHQLSKAHGQIEDMRVKNTEQAARAEALHAELGRVRYRLENLVSEAEAANTELRSTQEKLVALDNRAAILQAANVTLRSINIKSDMTIREISNQMDALAISCNELRAEHVQTASTASSLATALHMLAAMRNSTSWRITKPMRSIRQWFM